MQTTLELNVSNDLVQAFGINALQKHLQKRLELLKMQLLADKIDVGIKQSSMNWEEELDNARSEAWKEYKQNKNKK